MNKNNKIKLLGISNQTRTSIALTRGQDKLRTLENIVIATDETYLINGYQVAIKRLAALHYHLRTKDKMMVTNIYHCREKKRITRGVIKFKTKKKSEESILLRQ